MSDKLPLTALIAARNEQRNLGSCLASLAPAKRVVVVDSGSTDATAAIAERAGAEVVQFEDRGGYPKKRQWALDHLDIATDWILLVDADERIPSDLWSEIGSAIARRGPEVAFLATKQFHFLGRRFRFGGFSHRAVVLFRTGRARFEHLIDDVESGLDMEVHERLLVDGPVGRLETPLVHRDEKDLAAYLDRHDRYATWEARLRHHYLREGSLGPGAVPPRLFGDVQERRRFLKALAMRLPGEPIVWFLYHYVLRLGFLEGRPGLLACRIRARYIAQVRAKLALLRRRERSGGDQGGRRGA